MDDARVAAILERLGQRLDAIDGKLGELLRVPAMAPAAAGGEVASDADLDSQYGDPTVRKTPPKWTGDPFDGRRFSECTVEQLEALISFLAWQAGKDEQKNTDEGRKYAGYKRKDIARAKGWIRRAEQRPPEAAHTLDGDGTEPF